MLALSGEVGIEPLAHEEVLRHDTIAPGDTSRWIRARGEGD
jgi:hypothetical protein